MIVENPQDFFVQQEEWMTETLTVSSLRLDTVIASIFNISRQKSASLIQSGKVKVNWSEKDQVSLELQELDLISIRGLWKSQIIND